MTMAISTPDPLKQDPRKWTIGNLKVSNKDADKISWKAYPFVEIPEEVQSLENADHTGMMAWKYADYFQDDIFPDIGPPPRHPPKTSWLIMSIFMVLLLVLPWSFLIKGWKKLQVNVNGLRETIFVAESSLNKENTETKPFSLYVSWMRLISAVTFLTTLFLAGLLLVVHWLFLDLFSFLHAFSILLMTFLISSWFHLYDVVAVKECQRSSPRNQEIFTTGTHAKMS